MIRRSRWREAACSIMRTAIGSTPVAALMTTAAVSTASSAGRLWPRKSAAPGVSIKCTRVVPRARWSTLALSECCIRRSIASKSLTVVPRSGVPGAPIAPAAASRASARLVLPAAAGPTNAIVRIDATSAPAPEGGLGMRVSPSAGPDGGRQAMARCAVPDYGSARRKGWWPLSHEFGPATPIIFEAMAASPDQWKRRIGSWIHRWSRASRSAVSPWSCWQPAASPATGP